MFPGWLFAQHPSSGVSVLVLWFGAEGQAYGCDHPGGGEVAQVCAAPREPPDGAVAPVQFPPRDFCLASLGMLELDLDPRDVLPPLKSDRPDAGPIIR